MAAVKDTLLWSDALREEIKDHLRLTGDADHAALEALFNGAVEAADAYLNNPFECEIAQVTFNGVTAGMSVSVNGIAFTAAAALNAEEREFAVGADDSATAANFAALVNDTTVAGSYAVGVRGVKATATGAVVKVETRNKPWSPPDVTSDDDVTLRVQYVVTDRDLPADVRVWVFKKIARDYEDRLAGTSAEQIPGAVSRSFGSQEDEYAGLARYRLEPGLVL